MKIVFIRHSESIDDTNNSYGGCADWALTENGIKKVKDKINFFKKFNIDKFYSSPLSRAYQTAEILSFGKQVEKVFDLREINTYGVMSGLEKTKAKELFTYLLVLPEYKNIGYYHRKSFFGGENVVDFDNRVKNAIDDIIKSNKDNSVIAVVTHGGVFRSIFKNLLKIDKNISQIEDAAYAFVNFDKNFKIIEMEGIVLE